MKWISKMTSGLPPQKYRGRAVAKSKTVKVTASVCAASLLTLVIGASLGVVSPVSPAAADEITPAPGVTLSPLPLPSTSLPSIPSIPSGGLPTGLPSDIPTSLPTGIPTALPPITTPDRAPKPADDQPFTENDLNVDVGKTLTINADASGEILANSFNVSTNVSGQGTGTIKVPVGPNNPRDVSSFARLEVENNAIVYDVSNEMPEVQNLAASVGQYSGDMPISVTTRMTQNGQSVDPNSAKLLTGNIEVEWEFTNKTTSNEQISYRGPGGATVTEVSPVSIPFGVGLSATFGSGWADVSAPWGSTGFATGQVVAGAVQLKDSSVVATLSGVADNAKWPQVKIKATPKDSTNATSGLVSKAAGIGTEVDDFLEGTGVPLLVKLQALLGEASTGIAGFLSKNVDPLLETTAQLSTNPKKAEKEIAALQVTMDQVSDTLFMLNEVTAGATRFVASKVADATSPTAQSNLQNFLDTLNNGDELLQLALAVLPTIETDLSAAITGLAKEITGITADVICPKGQKPCTGTDIIDADILDLLPTTCVAGDQTRTYLKENKAPVKEALDAAITNLSGDESAANLTKLQGLLVGQEMATWDVTTCTAAAKNVASAGKILISDLAELSADIKELTPLLEDVDTGLKDVQKSLENLLAKMPAINYALDHDCSPAVISNISECGLVQAMEISAASDAVAKEKAKNDIGLIISELREPMRQIFAVANDIGRASIPLERMLDDLPNVINKLGNGPFGAITGEVEGIAGMASRLTTSASKTVAINNAVDQKFHSGQAFPYGSATGAQAATSATYALTLEAPGKPSVSRGVAAAFAGVLLIIMMGLSIWLSRRASAV
ncbi:MAG: hypothetical protein ACJAY5_000439 [Actinomycetes bacterium]|jgi:hypothetical protein